MLIYNLQSNRFSDVNKAAINTYGYTIKEFTEMSLEDIRLVADENNRVSENSAGKIYRHKRKDNSSIICVELSRTISLHNSPACLLSVNNITELEKAKSELIQGKNQLNRILNSITDGFFILSPNFVVEKANELCKNLVEVDFKQIEGQSLLDLFPSIRDGFSHHQYALAIASQSPVNFDNYYIKSKKWFHVFAYPNDGGLAVFFRDITKEKNGELERHQNEQNLLSLINNTEDLMWSVDCDFKYYIFNEPYRNNYKKRFGDDVYIGKCALHERHGPEHIMKWKLLYEKALQGETFTIDMEYLIDNEASFATVRFNPIYDANKNIIGAGCFMQNITERKVHLRKIEQQNKQLKEIAFITSHEVRGPLANILGLAEILDIDDPLNPSNAVIVEHIKTSAKQLDTSIINMVQQTVLAND
jgi:PAS domain-containing protein